MNRSIFLLSLMLIPYVTPAQQATVREVTKSFTTYPFSNPDPVANKGAIYPYYRFEDFAAAGVARNWKTIELENDHIKVVILPEIGGKIWSATEKATGKDFVYNNHVIKFRDVAMRGPWTSGGIEANYGIIGHTPNCATPVDYSTRTNPDGSVSCFIGTLDLLTQTHWTIEIRLPADKAWFSTRSWWFNNNAVEQPYYTWMNVGLKAAGNLEFIYPGNAYIGHEGEYASWPRNTMNGKNIARYEENGFGSYKSYHVFGRYADFFGAYWHDDKYGMARYSRHDQKAGKKIWIWGLSRQGMIWDKLLTDNDGQYVEVQSGRLFNQSADGSSLTPFKHFGFAPYQADTWTEYWYPVTGTGGFVTTTPAATLQVGQTAAGAKLTLQAHEAIDETFTVTTGTSTVFSKRVRLKPMETFRDSLSVSGDFTVRLGERLTWSTRADDELSRPKDSPSDFDWNTAYGLYLAGKEAVRSRYYDKAQEKFEASLSRDHNFLPALSELASLMLRKGDAIQARALTLRALAIDTYDPSANFIYGLANVQLGRWTDARDGFDIAALSGSHRAAAYTELARLSLMLQETDRAIEHTSAALEFSPTNAEAWQLQAVAYRLKGRTASALESQARLDQLNPLHPFTRAERWISGRSDQARTEFTGSIRNEMPHETFLQLADWYCSLGRLQDAAAVLSVAPATAEILYWRAWLISHENTTEAKSLLTKANAASAELVFPFRERAKTVFDWAITQSGNWKPRYYLALVHRGQKNLTEADRLIKSCGETPDFAGFYALRADMTSNDASAERDLIRATTLSPNQWIYGKRLYEVYVRNGKNQQALTLAQNYLKKHPANTNVIMMLARALLLNKLYPACTDLLAKSTLLPYEGSTDTRQIWWSAHVLSAADKVRMKRYAEATVSLDKARTWPENLGVGKPYEADIDQRAEWLIEAAILRRSSKPDEAEVKLKAIAEFTATHPSGLPYGTLAEALRHRISRSEEEGKAVLEIWVSKSGQSPLAQWCLEKYQGISPSVKIPADQQRVATALFEMAQ